MKCLIFYQKQLIKLMFMALKFKTVSKFNQVYVYGTVNEQVLILFEQYLRPYYINFKRK